MFASPVAAVSRAMSFPSRITVVVLLLAAGSSEAKRCEVEGVSVNPDNGATTAGKTGQMRCYRKDRDARVMTESFRDDGSLRERLLEQGRRRLAREDFDEQGRLAEEWSYAPEGDVARHRKFAADGSVVLEEVLFPDGSRKSMPVEAQIGG